MHMIADASSFLGSVWFAGLTFLGGYILGHVFPMHTLFKKR
jgi:hypothetical protein